MKVLIDRKDIAEALNSGKYPVLTYNVDTKKGSLAIIEKETEYGLLRYRTTLYRGKQTEDDGIFWLMRHASVLKATVHVEDWIECANYANAPVIESNQEVAILIYSEKYDSAVVQIVNSGRVDTSCATAATFS